MSATPRQGPVGGGPPPTLPDHGLRGVLRIASFRRLWISLSISSFGDWLGLLATTAMAAELGSLESYAQANLAVSGVLVLRLLPALLFGPIAGVVADRFDRKTTMVVGDLLRAALFVSIPVVGTLPWLFAATVLIEIIGLFWIPAKDASVPNLVPKHRLEAANQLSLATTYGTAPLAAVVFTLLALLYGVISPVAGFLRSSTDLALYLDAGTYLYAAWVVSRLEVPRRGVSRAASQSKQPGFWSVMIEGWRFVAGTHLMRGLVIGMLGAFGAGGFVVGVAPTFARDLQAGSAGYGILFGSVFTGLAIGMWLGPRVLAQLRRWRLFSLAIVAAAVCLAMVALVQQIVLATMFTLLVGAAAGVAWVTGYTMLGAEVEDEMRGRTFAFVQSSARVVLVAVMAAAPGLAALLGSRQWRLTDDVAVSINGTSLTLLIAAMLALLIGVIAYRIMDDHGELTLRAELAAILGDRARDHWWVSQRSHPGFLLAVEGGDGCGKSTQVEVLSRWLSDAGHAVVRTREPGATELGQRIRQLVLHGSEVAPRAEALLFAADRADHVANLIRPALERGAIVVTDRFVDSSIAYQAVARDLGVGDVGGLSHFATGGLIPDMTILLDLDPIVARSRRGDAGADRIETEAAAFHDKVRSAFLAQARRNPHRYLILDASAPAQVIATSIKERVTPLLPVPAQVGPDDETQLLSAGSNNTGPTSSESNNTGSNSAGSNNTRPTGAESNSPGSNSPGSNSAGAHPSGTTKSPPSPTPDQPSAGQPPTPDEWSRPWRGR